jgi:hypothetical protein
MCLYLWIKLLWTEKMLCTFWPRNPLTSSGLACLGREGPQRQFLSRFVKKKFRGLDMQIYRVSQLRLSSLISRLFAKGFL